MTTEYRPRALARTRALAANLATALTLTVIADAPAHAESVPVPIPPGLKEQLQARYPSTRFGTIHPTPWPGVYEVPVGQQIAYVDATGQYFLFGRLFDLQAQRDLTAERMDRTQRIDVSTLPLQDAIKEVRGTGSRTLILFSDPDCPYCRKLDAELKTLNDLTLHTFLLPLPGLHPQARTKAIAIWCSPDRQKAWQAVLRNETPKAKDCPHPVDRTIDLAQRLGITGTPTLIAADGRVNQGALTRDQLEAWLSRSDARTRATASTPGAPK